MCAHRDLPPQDAGVCPGTAWGEVVLLLEVPDQSQEVSICSAGFGAMAPR